jgi:hypothetical protein
MARRAWFIAFALGTIAVGLLVHLRGAWLGPAARDVAGDALWAAMLAAWVGALVPRVSVGARSGVAYLGCVGVELSQLYHAPALDAIRATRVGHLVLGSGFDPRDLAAYAAGVAGAALVEGVLTRHSRGDGELPGSVPDEAGSASRRPGRPS